MSIGNMFIKLGFSIAGSDVSTVANFEQKVTALSTAFLASTNAAKISIDGINGMVQAITSNVASLQSFANVTGDSTEEMRAFRLALSESDPTISLQQGLTITQNLIQSMSKALIGAGGNIKGFALTGVDFAKLHAQGKDFEIIKAMANAYSQGGEGARSFRSALVELGGLPPNALAGLEAYSKRPDYFKDFAHRTQISPENIQKVQALSAKQFELQESFTMLGATITGEFSPILIKVVDDITLLIVQSDKLYNNIKKDANAFLQVHPTIKKMADGIAELIPWLIILGGSLGALKTINDVRKYFILFTQSLVGMQAILKGKEIDYWAKGIKDAGNAAALATPKFWAMISPFVKLSIALAGIFAIFKDISNYTSGKKSFIGFVAGDNKETNDKIEIEQRKKRMNQALKSLPEQLTLPNVLQNIWHPDAKNANTPGANLAKWLDNKLNTSLPVSGLPSVKNINNTGAVSNAKSQTITNNITLGDIKIDNHDLASDIQQQLTNGITSVSALFGTGGL